MLKSLGVFSTSLLSAHAHMGISSPVPRDASIGDSYRYPVSSDNNPANGGACHGKSTAPGYSWVWTPRASGTCEIYQNCFDQASQSLTMSFGAAHQGGPCKLYKCTGDITIPPCTRMSLPDSFGSCTAVASTDDCTILGSMPGSTETGGSQPPTTAGTPPTTAPGAPDCTAQHTVASGDYMAKIAQQYGVSLDALISANPQVADPALLQIGWKLFIPPCSVQPPTISSAVTKAPTPAQVTQNTYDIALCLCLCSASASAVYDSGPKAVKDCSCAEAKTLCQSLGCSYQVAVNQCWGSPPFHHCLCTDSNIPITSHLAAGNCARVCEGSSCRSATDICTLPNTCVASGTGTVLPPATGSASPTPPPVSQGRCLSLKEFISDAFCQKVDCDPAFWNFCSSSATKTKQSPKIGDLQCQLYATKGIESLNDVALVFDTQAGKLKTLNEISVSLDAILPAGQVLEIPGACELARKAVAGPEDLANAPTLATPTLLLGALAVGAAAGW